MCSVNPNNSVYSGLFCHQLHKNSCKVCGFWWDSRLLNVTYSTRTEKLVLNTGHNCFLFVMSKSYRVIGRNLGVGIVNVETWKRFFRYAKDTCTQKNIVIGGRKLYGDRLVWGSGCEEIWTSMHHFLEDIQGHTNGKQLLKGDCPNAVHRGVSVATTWWCFCEWNKVHSAHQQSVLLKYKMKRFVTNKKLTKYKFNCLHLHYCLVLYN